jgi:glycosyltransferase involved in cell wall biosynthesis
MSICLNMIVKNEAHIIEKTLENICNVLPISYWVISDTGSTDDTKQLIQHFFDKKNIKGELVEHEWRDFAYNRTKALECAYQKTDYLFIFDADDRIEGSIVLPKLKCDKYMIQFGKEFSYERPLLITNRKPWFYTGVIHEFLDSKEMRTIESLRGTYYVESGRSGARSKNPNKYMDDAIILKHAFEEEPRKDLKTRYAFYCGQSYMDSNHTDEAIEWYKKTIDLNGWDQERYYSCIQLGELYRRKSDFINMQQYWARSCQYDPERIEGIVMLMSELQKLNQHVMVNALFHRWREYNHDLKNKLFIRTYLYMYEIEFINSISAYYARDFESGYSCCKSVIYHHKDSAKIEQAIKNLLFYKSHFQKDKKMIQYVKNKNPELFTILMK